MKTKYRIKTRSNLRAQDIADELSAGLSTVWLWSKQGKITPIKVSSRVTVFSIDEINKVFGVDIKKEIKIEVKPKL